MDAPKWVNLEFNQCPKCSKELTEAMGMHICKCGFEITEREKQNKLRARDRKIFDDYSRNLSKWNNFKL